jgi:maltoporin
VTSPAAVPALIYYHPFGPTGGSWFGTSFWQVSAIYGYGASELFGPDPLNQGGTLAGYNLNKNLGIINSNGSISSSSLRTASQFRATGQVVWNATHNFAIAAEVHYRYDDQGALASQPIPLAGGINSTSIETTGGAGWQVGGGIRPVYWLSDWFAIQGQAGIDYVHNNRSGGTAFNPGTVLVPKGTVRNDSFGKSGAMGIFTIAPTIKPIGNWWTRPEFRVFATYAIWDKSLRGSIGNNSPTGTPYQNQDQGWVFGTQVEWFF